MTPKVQFSKKLLVADLKTQIAAAMFDSKLDLHNSHKLFSCSDANVALDCHKGEHKVVSGSVKQSQHRSDLNLCSS